MVESTGGHSLMDEPGDTIVTLAAEAVGRADQAFANGSISDVERRRTVSENITTAMMARAAELHAWAEQQPDEQ